MNSNEQNQPGGHPPPPGGYPPPGSQPYPPGYAHPQTGYPAQGGPYHPPPGQGYYPPPARSRKGLIAALVGVGVFVLLIAAYLSPLGTGLFGPDRPFGPGTPSRVVLDPDRPIRDQIDGNGDALAYAPPAAGTAPAASPPAAAPFRHNPGDLHGRFCENDGGTLTFDFPAQRVTINRPSGRNFVVPITIMSDYFVMRMNGQERRIPYSFSNRDTLNMNPDGRPQTARRC